MIQRVIICSEVKGLSPGAVAKASVNSANKLHVIDPKASDLTMVRVKRM